MDWTGYTPLTTAFMKFLGPSKRATKVSKGLART